MIKMLETNCISDWEKNWLSLSVSLLMREMRSPALLLAKKQDGTDIPRGKVQQIDHQQPAADRQDKSIATALQDMPAKDIETGKRLFIQQHFVDGKTNEDRREHAQDGIDQHGEQGHDQLPALFRQQPDEFAEGGKGLALGLSFR